MTLDRREALLDAAERAILRDGYAGASTRGIAADAGVPLSLVHYYFGSKAGLLVAVAERSRERLLRQVAPALAQPGSARSRVQAALAVAREIVIRQDDAGRLLLELAVAALHSDPLRVEVQRLLDETGVVVAAITRSVMGDPAPESEPPVPPESVATLLIAVGLGLTLHRTLSGDAGPATAALDTLWRLLLDRGGPPATSDTGETGGPVPSEETAAGPGTGEGLTG